MSRAVDILINGVDNFSKTAEGAEKSGKELAKELSSAFNKVAVAVLGATTALEVMNREQRSLRETLERTAYFMDTSSESLRELAVNIANVTRPVEDVTKGFQALMQRGIQNEEHLARLAIQYDTLADAIGENMLPVIEQVAPIFSSFGDNIAGVERYGDKLVHTFESTSLNLEDFNSVMRRSRIYLTGMGLDMDDAISILYGLGTEAQNSGQAMYMLQRAARRADGDLDKFLEIAKISKEELAEYKEELENSEGAMADLADIHADSYTPIQKLLSIVERLKLRYGETIETLGSLMTVIGIVIGGIWVLSSLTTSLATNVWLAHKALVALAGFFGTTAATLFWWAAGATAAATGFAYLVETMTDEVAGMERSMERLEDIIESVAEDSSREAWNQWSKLEDVPKGVMQQWENDIKKGLGVDIDIREEFDTIENFRSFLEKGVASLGTDIANTDDVGGVITQAITDSLENVKPTVDKAINSLEDWLFDTLDAMDFEAFDGKMGEIIENSMEGTTLTDGLTAGDIDEIMSEVERKLGNVDELLKAGQFDTGFELLEGYAEATKGGLEELLNGGLKPTSNEVQKLFNKFIGFTSQMDNGAEKAEYLNEAFIGLLDTGITPSTKGYEQFKQAVIDANNAVVEPGKQIEQRDEIIKAYREEIENIELLADKKAEAGQAYDEEEEKLKVYEGALKQLIPLYGVSQQEIDKLTASIAGLTEEDQTLAESMDQSRRVINKIIELDAALGDALDLSSDKTAVAQKAVDKLTQAWLNDEITLEQFKEEVKDFNKILNADNIDNYTDSLEELNTQLKNINEMERVGVLDEAEADQRRLNNVNRQMELMVNNQEHINEETGKVTQEFKDLLVEAGLLEEKLDQSKGSVEEIGHSWRRVLNVIGQNVSAVGAFQETIENIKDTRFNFSDIELPEGMDLGIDLGGIGEKIGGVFSKISDKLGSFISKSGTFLSAIMPMLKESKYFGKVMESLGRIMQPVVEIFGIILEVLYPFIRIIEIVLVPVLRAFGAIIRALIIPVFRALFPVIKMFGVVITSVAEVIARVVGVFSSSARKFANQMKVARKELLDLSWDDLQKEMKSTADGMNKVNEELHNIPSGFKLNLERFNAIEPGTPPMEEASDQTDYGDMEDSWDESGEMIEEGGVGLKDTLLAVGGLVLISGKSVSNTLNSVGTWVLNSGRSLWNGLRNVGNWILNSGRGLWRNLKSVGSWVLSGGKSLGSNLVTVAKSLFSAGDSLVSVVADIAGSLLSGGGSLLGTVISGIGSFFGGIFHGGGKIPGKKGEEKMILAQAGEMVIPLDMVENLEKKKSGLLSKVSGALFNMGSSQKENNSNSSGFQGFFESLMNRTDEQAGLITKVLGIKEKDNPLSQIFGSSVSELSPKTTTAPQSSSIISETQDNRQTHNHYHYNFDNVEIVSDDPEEIWRQLKRIMKRENYEKTGSTLKRDNRYA